MEFQFSEEVAAPKQKLPASDGGGNTSKQQRCDWYVARSVRSADLLVGVHGGALTNVVHMPIVGNLSDGAPIVSRGGGVMVELGNSYFVRTQQVQHGMFGTFSASLGIPHAQVVHLPIKFHKGPANFSYTALEDAVALGVCMWCTHNTENPLPQTGDEEVSRGPVPSATIEGVFKRRCAPDKIVSGLRDATPPLPSQHWRACCRCVSNMLSAPQKRKPPLVDGVTTLLRYDVPIAPLVEDFVPIFLGGREIDKFFERGLVSLLVSHSVCIECSYEQQTCTNWALIKALEHAAAYVADINSTAHTWVLNTLRKDLTSLGVVVDDIPSAKGGASFLVLESNSHLNRSLAAVAAAGPRTMEPRDYVSTCSAASYALATGESIEELFRAETSRRNVTGLELLLGRFVDDESCLPTDPVQHPISMLSYDALASALRDFVIIYCSNLDKLSNEARWAASPRPRSSQGSMNVVASAPTYRHRSVRVKRNR